MFFHSLPTPRIVVPQRVPAFGTETRKQGGMKENMHESSVICAASISTEIAVLFTMQCVPARPELSVSALGWFSFLKVLSWQQERSRKRRTFFKKRSGIVKTNTESTKGGWANSSGLRTRPLPRSFLCLVVPRNVILSFY